MNAHHVEQMLRDQPTPPPPEGLAEKIKAEIPDQLPAMPELRRIQSVVPFRRRYRQLAAAAGFLVAITATVTWQMRRDVPLEEQIRAFQAPAIQPSTVMITPFSETESVTELGPLERVEEKPQELLKSEVPPGSTPGKEEGRSDAERIRSGRKTRQFVADATPDVINEFPATTSPAATNADSDRHIEAFRADSNRRIEVFTDEVVVSSESPLFDLEGRISTLREHKKSRRQAPPSTGGTAEPNDAPFGDVFFREYGVNPFIDTEDDRLSTFGLDVDTGSYTVVRRYLRDGHLPPREAVRVEELVNYFDYGDQPPSEGDFALTAEGAPSPFAEGKRYQILRFAVNARSVDAADRPAALLVFVVDVSGSMDRENRLGLVKKSLYELLDNLRADDRVGLVVYGSRGEVVLEPSTDHQEIRSAIDRLQAGGSTNAEEGLVLGYRLADRFRDETSINRVILCSDGVANVGRTGPESILERIKVFADQGIELTAVGFGMGNYNDVLMERLADTGDGRYAYVDALPEARRIFVEELTGTLMTIGAEAKAQVEFNPEVVSRYRLLGYENRDIADERFRDPTVDAGEIGAGHTVTALYEIKLHEGVNRRSRATLATLRMRYRPRGERQPVELEERIRVRDLTRKWENASPALRLATLVGEYAEILKGAYWARDADMNEVLRQAQKLSPSFAGNARVADWVALAAAAAELQSGDDTALKISTE
ncbi:MAG: von Willebrand factor type A domain-containing protein [Thermoanaerobaculales bacterium]